MYRQIAMNITSYHSTAYAHRRRKKNNKCINYICGIIYIEHPQRAVPLVFRVLLSSDKVPPRRAPRGKQQAALPLYRLS